jgi:tetratricopeptide (TPR) repeat protein
LARELLANRFQVLGVLGEGAMGRVLRVFDQARGEEVALKVITGARDKSTLQFRREFRLMTGLRHPNCCAVYDYGLLDDGDPYFTMEIVPGHGLDERLPLPPERFGPLFAQLLLALGYVHRQGLVHLDVKAANVRVMPDGTLKLMDFGLMEYAGQGNESIRGTLPYVSPEMARRAPVDRRSDLYSAGVLAYELLTGRLPFPGPGAIAVLRAHLTEPPPALHGVPPELARIVRKLLAKEPVERYQSADEVLADLGHEPPAGIGGSLLTSPLVGREAELAVLQAGLAAVEAGRPGGIVHLYGAPGIGKRRLVEELRVQVQLAHVPFARGRAPEHQRVPYAPLVELVRGLLPVMQGHVPGALAAAAPVLVGLWPEVGGPPAPAMESPRHEMLRLQATLTELLKALAAVRPFVAVLENWQWADEPSVEFVTYARRNLGDAPVLLVLAADRAPEPVLGTALALNGLPPAALERMVANMLGSEDVGAAFAGAIGAATGRNPLHVERLLEHLVKAGHLVRRAGRWDTALDPALVALPASLEALLAERLAELPAGAVAVARAVAVHERPAPIELLQAVTGLEDTVLFDALAALQRAQVLAPDDHGRYAFGRAPEREVVYAGLAPAERQALHHAVAGALLGEAAGRPLAELPADLVVALATHARHGARAEEAITYCLEAGRRAVALFALADAEDFLASGLALLDATGGARGPERLAYLRLLGETQRQAGHAKEALGWLAEAVAAAEVLAAGGLAGLLTSIAACHLMLAQYDEAIATADRAARLGQAGGEHTGTARAYRTIGRAQFFRGDLAAAREAAERALEHAEAGGEPGIRGLAYAFSGFLEVAAAEPGGAAAGVERLERAIGLLQEVGDRVGLNDAYNLIGNAHLTLGDPQRARAVFEASAGISRENGLREEESVALVSLAGTAVELGAPAEAREQAAQAHALAAEIGAKLPLGMAMAVEGLAAAYLGDLAPALALPREAAELAHAIGNRYLESAVLPPRVEALVQLGRLGEADEACLADTDSPEAAGALGAWGAIALALRDRPEAALARVATGEAAVAQTGSRALAVLLGQARALVALRQARWEEARAHAEAALGQAEALGLLPRAAELRGLLGESALAVGDRAAREHFEAMGALATRTHIPALRAEALFGLAASEPYAPHAQALADEAGAILRGLVGPLSPAEAGPYLDLPPRRRVLEGNYLAFGLPHQRRQPPPTGGFGLNWTRL